MLSANFDRLGTTEQFLVNRRQFGYYRVEYSENILDILKQDALRKNEVNPINKRFTGPELMHNS